MYVSYAGVRYVASKDAENTAYVQYFPRLRTETEKLLLVRDKGDRSNMRHGINTF